MVANISSILKIIRIAFHKPYDTSIEGNYELERNRRVALTAFTSLIAKFFSAAIPIISVRITYDYLGVEVYGLWSAVITFFSLFDFSDLGLGNGLQTKLSQAVGKNDQLLCCKLISSTYLFLWIIAFVLLLLFVCLYPILDWTRIMNATSIETIKIAAPVVFVIVLPKIISIPIAIITRTQYALQEGYRSNIWGITAQIFSFLFIVLASRCDFGKVSMLAGSSFIPFLVSGINMFVYFKYQNRKIRLSVKYVDKKLMVELLSLGLQFCILSILLSVGVSMDTFIVARTGSLAEAAPYSVIYKVTTVMYSVVMAISSPLWAANGEAIARGDFEWVNRTTRKLSFLLSGLTLLVLGLFICCSRFIFNVWLGPEFDYSVIAFIGMAGLQVIMAYISPYFMILNAIGDVKHQLLLFGVFTPLSFGLKYLLSTLIGINVIPYVGFVLYLTIIVVGVSIISKKQLFVIENR